jgi:restriction system protein
MAAGVRMKFDDALSRVAWQDFEVLVANHYRDLGYDVLHCGDGQFGRLGGSEVDLRMLKGGKLTLVLCRHESVSRVNADDVARLIATGAEHDGAKVIVVSSGDIPEAARQVGEAGGATLIDGVAVRAMLGERLMDLHPVRSLPGVDPQHGESHVVMRSDLPRSRARRAWRLLMPSLPSRRARGRRRGQWPVVIFALLLAALIAFYAAPLRRLVGLEASPPAGTAAPTTTSTTQELPLPKP